MEISAPSPHCAQDHICWGAHASHPERHRLDVENVTVYYGRLLALHDIGFSITCGHTLALMGPNGAGKSTLIKALAGLIDHVRTGRVAPGETVVFWHTGGATALFAEQAILGDLAKK